MKTLVIEVHNSSVVNVWEALNDEEAKNSIRDAFFHQIGRPMNDAEIDDLEDKFEVFNDDDHDNHYTYSIFFIE